jgi:hypothetical protein
VSQRVNSQVLVRTVWFFRSSRSTAGSNGIIGIRP